MRQPAKPEKAIHWNLQAVPVSADNRNGCLQALLCFSRYCVI